MSLPQHHHRVQIQQNWLRATESAMEAGQSPLLESGMDRRLLNDIPVLLAYAEWCARRNDVTQPVMITGGVDALWPVPLLFSSDRCETQNSATLPVQLVYGGADRATYLASLTTHAADHVLSGTRYAIDLPPAMQPLQAAQTAPQTNATWRALPLTLLQDAKDADRRDNLSTYSTTLHRRHATAPTGFPDLWLAWIALVLTVALILLALFV
ncbi:MAG: hypothetical protein R2932_15355 [Caldilineaceae bacterium]